MTTNIRFNTDLLEPQEWNKAIKTAQEKIEDRAIGQLQSLTPVDTGLLTSQWRFKGDRLGLEIDNSTPYGRFIDKGTKYIKPFRITERSVPIITDMYEQQILDEIEKL